MRGLLAGFAILGFVGAADPAATAEYPWCVTYSMNGDTTNCGFVSYEQCRMTASGMAGYCARNPFYGAARTVVATPRAATKRQP